MRVRRAKWAAAVFACLAMAPLTAREANAQVIRGVVVDSATHQPLTAVLVSLADSADRNLQRFLADANGTFRFSVPRPGRYTVRAERLGMTTEMVEQIDVAAGQTVSLRITLAHLPITLEGLQASGDRRCELSRDLGVETLRVWEEARKALNSADYTSSAGVYVHDLGKYVRELEPGSLKILSESNSFWSTMTERPIESRPVEVLLDGGWVVRKSGGNRYFGPDAHVLLSDEFLDTHCMQLRPRDESNPRLVGLEFRPVRIQSRRSGIQGVLWLSRETGGLEWLEFSYLNLPGLAEEVDSDQIGGRVDFRSLPDGTWIVSKWYIRMPRVVEEVGRVLGFDLRRPRLKGIVEEGGWVMEVRTRETGRIAFAEHGGAIKGQVRETGDAVMEFGGRVALVGVGVAADLDSEGRFVIPGLPEGTYQLSYLRPSLGGLDRDYPLADAVVRFGDTTTVGLEAADRDAVLARACGLREWTPYTGVLQGHVLLTGSRLAASGTRVVARWEKWRSAGSGPLQGRAMHVATETNAIGAYRLCGIPTDLTGVEVTAGEGRDQVSATAILSEERPVVTITLELVREPPDGPR